MAEQDGRLILTILGPDGALLNEAVDIHLRHQVLSHVLDIRDQDASRKIAITNLHRSPQGLYRIRVTPQGSPPVSQFITIKASGDTELDLSVKKAVDLDKPLDRASPIADAFLEGLQGNILKSHARLHAWHLFISFGSPEDRRSLEKCAQGARKWIRGLLAKGHITTALAQEGQQKTDTFRTLLLSSQGYAFLDERRPGGGAFRDGLRSRASRLNDPTFEQWEDRYKHPKQDVHALMVIATEDLARLDAAKDEVGRDLQAFGGRILVQERGDQIRNADKRPIEHFGYADGVSQPQFISVAGKPEGQKFNQLTPLKRVLARDRHAEDGYGSYAVYRKLEQNVRAFNNAVHQVADTLGLNRDLVGAMAIGRFQNGTPLTTHPQPKPDYDPTQDEDFNYDADGGGGRCPFHAHIRKVNPRGSLGFFANLLAREQTRRIARRGITYGRRPDLEGQGGGPPSGGVGLIFICYQSDIEDQFEFIQRQWANNRNFSRPGKSGIDPVIGQDKGEQEPNDFPHWPARYDAEEDDRRSVRFGEHVRLLGGEYFFAPSMEGLRALSRGPA